MRIDEPTITDFTLAQHNHTSPATGGPIGFPPQLAGLFLTVLGDGEIFEPPYVGAFSGSGGIGVGPQGLQGKPGIDGVDNDDYPEAPFVGQFPIVSGSTITPGGSNKQVQFNDSSAFGGNAALTFDKATAILLLNGLFDISSAAGGQIKFPATVNLSANANTLDDYEEGIWVPADASSAALTFAVALGSYVQIGSFIAVSWSITYPVTATTNGAAFTIPFAASAVSASDNGYGGCTTSTNYNATVVEITLFGATTSLSLRDTGGAAVTNALMSGKVVRGFAIYRTS